MMNNLNKKWLLRTSILIFISIMFLPKAYSKENQILTVKRPAIIAVAYNPKIGVTNDELSAVLDDFSFYLGSATQKLEPLGVKFYTVEKQKVFFKISNKTDSIDLAREKAFVGYVFISSKGKVLKRFHVLTDIEILEIAQKHFDLKKVEQK